MITFVVHCFSDPSPRAAFLRHAAAVFFMAAFTVVYFWGFFDLSADLPPMPIAPGELANDLTPLFGVHAEMWRHSVSAHMEIPHWNPYIMAGEPMFPEPSVNFLSFENLLLFFFRGQVAARLSIPLHLFLGWIGLYLFLLRIGLRGHQALIAGIIYLYNPTYMGVHSMTGHPTFIHGVAIVPWLLHAAVRSFKHRISRFLWMGVLLGLMVHSGAETVFFYTCAFGFPAYLLYHLAATRKWPEGFLGLALTVCVFLGLSLVKLLPALDFISVSQRKYGMSAEMAFCVDYIAMLKAGGYYVQGKAGDILVASWGILVPLAALFLLGLVYLARRNKAMLGLSVGSMAFIYFLTTSFPFFEAVRKVIPLFQSHRTPQRAFFIAYLVAATLTAFGMEEMRKSLSRRNLRILGKWAAPVLLIAFALSAMLHRLPFPTMVGNLKEAREKNPVLRYVRNDPSFFRITSFQDIDEHWGWEQQTVPLGLRILVGFPRLWHNDMLKSDFTASVNKPQFPFVPAIYQNYSAMAGLLSVKYVSSLGPLQEQGLEFIGKLPIVSPDPEPPKSRGPYLYRNQRYLPRVYQGTRMLLLNGPWDWCREVGLKIIMQKNFRPDRLTVLYLPEKWPEGSTELFEKADAILSHSSFPVPPAFGGKQVHIWNLMDFTSSLEGGVRPLSFTEDSPQKIRIPLAHAQRGCWLVLSDPFSLFHGWEADMRRKSGDIQMPIYRCNHVNTALWIPEENAEEIVLSYRSPHFTSGMALMLMTIAFLLVYAVALRFGFRRHLH